MKGINNNSIHTLPKKSRIADHVAHKFKTFLFIALILFIIRLTYGPLTGLALYHDEAYFHFWSTQLAWGYHSKPPVVAWLIYLSTYITHSYSEWAVRLASPLLYFASAYLIYATAHFLYNRITGIYAAALFYTAPLVTFNSLIISTDAPLLFCWSLAIFCYVHTAKHDKWWAWAGLGISIGLGLLANYTMLVWLLGFLLFCLWQGYSYRHIFSVKTLSVVAIASVLILPNLLWNWQHDFVSFKYTAEVANLDQDLFHPSHLLDFIAGQFLVFGPVAFYLLLHLFWRPMVTHSIERLLLCLSLPLLLAMAVQALLANANINWAAPVYVAASIMLARALMLGYKYKLTHLLLVSNLVIGGLFYLYPQMQRLLYIEPTVKNTPFSRVAGWKPLFQSIPNYISQTDQLVWLSDSPMLLSYLHYYLPHQVDQPLELVSFNVDGKIEHQFDLHQDINQSKHLSFIFVSEQPLTYAGCFDKVQLRAQIKHAVYPSLERRLYFYQVSGFKGYAGCQN